MHSELHPIQNMYIQSSFYSLYPRFPTLFSISSKCYPALVNHSRISQFKLQHVPVSVRWLIYHGYPVAVSEHHHDRPSKPTLIMVKIKE